MLQQILHDNAPHELAAFELAAEGGPFLRGAWRDALMLHFAIDAEELQPHVPFGLDLFAGRAIITLVAFTMNDVRLEAIPGLPHWLLTPLEHTFLNVRTYVRHGGERGIFFLAEYVPKLLARVLGPMTYGLPYRFTPMRYEHDARNRRFVGKLGRDAGIFFEADYALAPGGEAAADTFEEFALERYNAFTRRFGRAMRFRVAHPPWRMHRARLLAWDDALLRADHAFWPMARIIGGHFTTGFPEVAMGAPRRVA